MTERRRTSTSNFGVGRREAHDARAFYARFEAPELSDDEAVAEPRPVAEPFVLGDARQMDAVADNSVALVVTSPPYFAGKQYEEELNREGIPSSYGEYLQLLEDVFSECVRTLEPGGRIAVNVANLGRKPYRSLAADVITILQDKLHLLLRGEVVWQKGEGASGSCAWGSFRSASNPVLRDLTERVVIASKGRFARAKSLQERTRLDLPHRNTIKADDFAAYTLDVWNVPPESARRVNHPAPFPVELPARLIELYTYEDDLVLDPFMGSGSTLVAADGLDRRYVGYDLDPTYVELARQRVADERASRQAVPNPGGAEKAKARGKGTQKGGRPAGKAAGRGRKGAQAEVEAAPPEDFRARASSRREGRAGLGGGAAGRGRVLGTEPEPTNSANRGGHQLRGRGRVRRDLVLRRLGCLHDPPRGAAQNGHGVEDAGSGERTGPQGGLAARVLDVSLAEAPERRRHGAPGRRPRGLLRRHLYADR